MPVSAAVSAGTATPWAPEDEAEQEEPDQEQPEQAEEREESEPKAVIARVDYPAVAASRCDNLGRLARVIGDQSHDRGDRDRRQPPDPCKAPIHFEPPFVLRFIIPNSCEGPVKGRRRGSGWGIRPRLPIQLVCYSR